MSLPSIDDLETLDIISDGLPFVKTSLKPSVDTLTMDYIYDGLPFVAPNFESVTIELVEIEELIIATDEHSLELNVLIQELGDVTDEENVDPLPIEELVVGLDQTLVVIDLAIEELITAYDEYAEAAVTDGAETFDQTSGMGICIGETMDENDGAKICIGEYIDLSASSNIVIGENTLIAATNASAEDNPFQPTVAVYGDVLISNPSTNPGSTDLNKAGVYTHWLSAGITGIQWTDLYNFNFELDYSGGHFSITSKKPLKTTGDSGIIFNNKNYHWPTRQGAYVRVSPVDDLAMSNLGKLVDIFTYKGTIVDFGPTISDNQAGWVTSGFFGKALLSKNMNLVTYGSFVGKFLGTTQNLNNTAKQKGDVQSMAQNIANRADINLKWYVQGAPLQDTFKLDGQTSLSALATLAGTVGGVLRWNGNDNYYVAYPNQSFGLWELPHAKLLTSAGLSYLQHLDLETGATGTSLFIIPKASVEDSGINNLPATGEAAGGLPTIQQINKLRQKLTDRDPPIIWDLPYDVDKIYIQLLVPESGSTSGGNQIGVDSFITKDPTEWFEFGGSTLTGTSVRGLTEYVFVTYMGNSYIPQVKLDYRLFPIDGVNTGIDEGEFVLSIACSVKSRQDLYDKNRQDLEDAAKEALAAGFDPARYVKTYSGSITCQFFGSIPMPGMWGRAVIPGGAKVYTRNNEGSYDEDRIPLTGDMVVEGIIEHVQFSFPGIVTVQVAQYAKIDFSGGRMTDMGIASFRTQSS